MATTVFRLCQVPWKKLGGRQKSFIKYSLFDGWDENASAAIIDHIVGAAYPVGLLTAEEMAFPAQINQQPLTREAVIKLHHYFGHLHPDRLTKLIQKAGRLDDHVKQYLEEIAKCGECAVSQPKIPRPKIAVPRSYKFNELVTIDLKENVKWQAPKYICFLICNGTKFKVGFFIPDKKKETIAEGILVHWCAPFWPIGMLQADRGSEFVNQELANLCDYLGTRMSHTAAYTPNANGVNERGHAVVCRMMDRILTADSTNSCLESDGGQQPGKRQRLLPTSTSFRRATSVSLSNESRSR